MIKHCVSLAGVWVTSAALALFCVSGALGQHGGHGGGGHGGGGHGGGGQGGGSSQHGGGGSWHGGGWDGGSGWHGGWDGGRGWYGRGWYGWYPGFYGYRWGYPYYGSGYSYPYDYSYGSSYPDYAWPYYGDGTNGGYGDDGTRLSTTDQNSAHIRVIVPADARVWFDDAPTQQTGSVRIFDTPTLEPGRSYSYQVRAQWTENGREVMQTRVARVHPGDAVTVDFTTPMPRPDTATNPGS